VCLAIVTLPQSGNTSSTERHAAAAYRGFQLMLLNSPPAGLVSAVIAWAVDSRLHPPLRQNGNRPVRLTRLQSMRPCVSASVADTASVETWTWHSLRVGAGCWDL
jgi:hypothetical protein